MKFKDLILLLERNITYKLPKDKEQQIYDFYFLTGIESLPYKKGRLPQADLDIGTETSIKEAVNTLVDSLKPKLLNALLFAISTEFRHIFDENTNKEVVDFITKLKGNKGLKFIQKYLEFYHFSSRLDNEFSKREKERLLKDRFKEDEEGYKKAYKVMNAALKKSGLKVEDFLEIAKESFLKLQWNPLYGGKSWANIVDGWFRLNDAKSYNEKVIAIDHVYDLQHNTNTVFNKLKSYYKGGYGWIKRALDFKKNIKDLWMLADFISSSAKTLGGYVLKAKGYGTLEDFNRNFYKDIEFVGTSKSSTNNKKTGTWKNGTWINGVWKNGTWWDGTWEDGIWEDGVWLDGIWEKGTWQNGTWKSGTWKDGVWLDGIWENGTWKNGIWINGEWNNGTWENGTWKNGVWKKGKWIKGWIYDPDGIGEQKYIKKKDHDYVLVKVDPKTYFSKESKEKSRKISKMYDDILDDFEIENKFLRKIKK